MRFLSVVAAAVGFFTTTALADGASIQAALHVVDEWNAKLNESFVNYDGTLFGAPPILDTTSTLIQYIVDGQRTAKKSAPLNETEATSIYTTVLALQTDVKLTLTTVVNSKAAFDKWSLGGIIYLTLKLVKKETDILSQNILKKVPDNLQSIAVPAVGVIDTLFDSAIAAYADED